MARLERAAAIAIVFGVILSSSPAGADVIAEETFSYAPGATVNGQSGGTGWSGAWITGQPSAFMSAAAISGGPSIGATGGAMQVLASGRIFRVIDTSAGSPAVRAGVVEPHAAMFFGTLNGIGVPGTTVWVGVLVSGGSGASGAETQYHLYEGARTDATSLALGDSNKDGEVIAVLRGGNVADWGFERTCNHSACGGGAPDGYFATSPAVPFGGTHWSVTRLVFHATTTDVTMWRDPTPGAVDPTNASALALTPFSGGAAVQTTTVPALHFDTVTPNASGNFNYFIDEIRITTTFAELSGGMVTPMPDAGSTTDAGAIGIDASSLVDGGTSSDGGTSPRDAATTTDGGSTTDAGATTDASAARDAAADASTGAPQTASCACRASGRDPSAPRSIVLVIGVLALVVRRRRSPRS